MKPHYHILDKLDALSLTSFLKAHALIMKDQSTSAGKIGTGGVAIIKGTQLTHVAPPAKMVKPLINSISLFKKRIRFFLDFNLPRGKINSN
jgi:Fic family protein